jgi:hypothetical protein
VDGNQESWEVKRLFITDASSLPDGLGGPNPTLTLQMFATRTAEHIAVTHFGRDPFVRQGLGQTTPAGFPTPSAAATPAVEQAAAEPAVADRGTLPATGGSLAAGAAALAAGAVLHQIGRRPS